MREGFPVNVLNAIKAVPEVCRIFCATANPVEVVVADGAARAGEGGDERHAFRQLYPQGPAGAAAPAAVLALRSVLASDVLCGQIENLGLEPILALR